MEKISVIVILIVIASAIWLYINSKNDDNSDEVISKFKKTKEKNSTSQKKKLITDDVNTCIITAKNEHTKKSARKVYGYDEFVEGKMNIVGRKMEDESIDNNLWFPLDCEYTITSKSHFAVFKQIDSVEGAKVTRFGVCDMNSKNGTFVRQTSMDEWVKVDCCEIKDGYEVKAGEYVLTFNFINYYDTVDVSENEDDDDVKIYVSEKSKKNNRRLDSILT